jgi:hypothetical protein
MRWRELLVGPLLLSAPLPACSNETVGMWPAAPVHFQTAPLAASPSSPVTPTDEERGVADAYMTALASPGFAALGPIVDDEAQFAFGARNTHGRDRVQAAHDDVFGAFDDRHFVANRVWLTDSTRPLDSQAIEWTMTGVQARAYMGIPPSHKPVVIKGLTLLWTNDDGIISELHVYFDEEVVQAQVGGGSAALQKLAIPSVGNGASQVFERSGTQEEKGNIALVRTMIQSLEDDKESEFLATLDDDIELFTSDHAEAVHGKAGAREYFGTMRKSVRLLDTVIRNAWAVREFTVTEYVITGLQRAPLPRVTFAEGRALHARFVDVAEFAHGRMVRIWRYSDPAAATQ